MNSSQAGATSWDLEAAASKRKILGNHFLFGKSD
jgi:hypothetical protein